MAEAVGEFAPFRLSIEAYPERERAAAWRELYGRKMLRLEIEPLSDVPFQSDLTVRALPGLGIVSGTNSPFRVGRTRELIADGNDGLILQISSTPGIASQLGREVAVRADDAVLLSNADVGSFIFPAATGVLALSLPHKALAPLVGDLDSALVRPVPRDTEALRLLRRYLGLLEETPSAPDLQHFAVTHVYDLVALALGATRDAAESAKQGGLRAARLNAIKGHIAGNLHRADLTVSKVAVRHGVTPRYVQMLFEAEGTTFSEFLRTRRLAHAHRVLTDLRHADRSVTDIAYGAGFGDLSHFNHAFRRLYGASPSDVRAGASRDEAMPAPGLASKRRNLWAGHDIFS